MAKGRAALGYLPQNNLAFVAAAPDHSISSIKSVLEKVADMQENGITGTFTSEKCNSNTPYTNSLWDINTEAAGLQDVLLTFVSETSNQISTIGRPALSTRRLINLVLVASANDFSVRSMLSVVNFIESLEDGVASSGSGASGDATYTDIVLKGTTPFETFKWTITKLANVYTVVATTES